MKRISILLLVFCACLALAAWPQSKIITGRTLTATDSLPVASIASRSASPNTSASTSAAGQSSAGKSATGWSSLPPDARESILAALQKDDPGWIQESEVTASDGAASDNFGYSVAVSGSTVVVGALNHAVNGNAGQGAAYVFVESGGTWTQQAELTASDGAASDAFGWSVAISGSTVVVGAPNHTVGSNTLQGAAYVFVQSGTTWTQQAELTSSDGAADDFFGKSVAVSSNTAVIGTCWHNYPYGAAYVFAESAGTWTQQAELTASGGFLGPSVAVDGSTAVVGAYGEIIGGNTDQGAAYVFVESGGTWTQQAELTASDGKAGDRFGWSVAVSGNTAAVGAPYDTVGSNTYQGAAYVFVESGGTWSQQAELPASDAKAYDYFAYSVALSGSTLVVGAYGDTVGSNADQGAAHVFLESGGTWTQQAELTASDGKEGDLFGYSVALSGSTAVAGAIWHVVGSNAEQGAAYVFSSSSTTVTLSPTSLSFGNQVLDTTSAAMSVTLKNTGTARLHISSIAITLGTSFTISKKTCGTTLAVGKTCKVSVTFTPAQLGALTDTLTFTDNASGSPQTVSLAGTGEADATLTPASYTFKTTKVGKTSAAHKFTLKNNQSTALTGISYSTSVPFAVSSSTCESTLNSKASCTISVTFSPTSEETYTGTLTVTDSANESPQTASLSGTGN